MKTISPRTYEAKVTISGTCCRCCRLYNTPTVRDFEENGCKAIPNGQWL